MRALKAMRLLSLCLVVALAGPTAALAQAAPADLAAQLKSAMDKAEATATAALFPRANILNAVSQSLWQTFYRNPASVEAQRAAIETVSKGELSPLEREAVERMKVELTLD